MNLTRLSAKSVQSKWNGRTTMTNSAHVDDGNASAKMSNPQNHKSVQVAKAANRILDNIEFYLTQEEITHIRELFAEEYAIIEKEIERAFSEVRGKNKS